MGLRSSILLISLLLSSHLGWGQNQRIPSEAVFIKNKGQWTGNFDAKLRINAGAFFFEESGFSLLLTNHPNHSHKDHHIHGGHSADSAYAVKLRWQNAKTPYISQEEKLKQVHHYYLGNDTTRWKSNVPLSKALLYSNIYDGVDLRYFGNGSDLEYDIVIAPNTNPDVIKYTIEGATQISNKRDVLFIETPLGTLKEHIPLAYQTINGIRYEVNCRYKINRGIVGFELGNYDENYPLVIDPILEFSTFTGSSADNFGFTATYDDNGNFYGGGVALASGYPTTAGVVDNTFGGGRTDVAITKFNANGTQALYSTYLGGNDIDLPHSMVCAPNGTLYVLGNTGSADFSMYPNAYQNVNNLGTPLNNTFAWQFPNGSDIFIIALNANGTAMVGGTFLGGDGSDGVNSGIFENYGDLSRGEIIVDDAQNVYITTSNRSSNNLFNGTQVGVQGDQDAVVASFNSDLSTLRWATLFGGSNSESGYGLKLDDNNNLFVTGGTESVDLSLGANAGNAFSSRKGNIDGYVAKFNASNGQLDRASYIGGTDDDQSFFVEVDRSDKVYLFGQSKSMLTPSPGVYSNPTSRQFITKLTNDLDAQEFYTVIGSGSAKSDLVPTAFLVDDCYKIYISGWNGRSNFTSNGMSSPLGNTNNLPTTNDAYQNTTDGSDFYFMVLDRDASSLVYASYFGGSSGEHVDGGTSRFDPKGIIYQAVCAGCGQQGFPTTPGAYSEINGSNNCNLGAIKFDFQASIRARADIDFDTEVDTVCNTLLVKFSNNSINADVYEWTFGNGLTANAEEPTTSYDTFGTYTVKLVAIDTVCDIKDSTTLSITHDQGVLPRANFEAKYADCDKTFSTTFLNNSLGSTNYEWDFGDGSGSTEENPMHQFPSVGIYNVTLIAKDSICNTENIIEKQIEFTDTIQAPVASVSASPCLDGSLDISVSHKQPWYQYFWDDNEGRTFEGESPRIVFQNSGFYNINFDVVDTLCNATYSDAYLVRVGAIKNEVYVPNAFTPNKDKLNEKFIVYGNECTVDDRFTIFDRWGKIVFQTDKPYTEFWDATVQDGKPAKEDVYIYLLKRGAEKQRGKITLIR